MKTLHRSRILLAAIPLAGIVLAAIPAAAAAGPAAARPHTVHVSGTLTVAYTAPPACTAGVCIIRNHGTGTLAPYGSVTFTTVITADGNQPPCGATSQWVNRIIRTITTHRSTLVLHEAGLQCPQPGTGPQVKAVWAADGADSTGIFADASGQGSDTAYPALNTAAPARNPHPLPVGAKPRTWHPLCRQLTDLITIRPAAPSTWNMTAGPTTQLPSETAQNGPDR